MSEPTVTFDEAASRYEIALAGERIGLADVLLRGEQMVVPHTEVDPAQQGRGYAAVLVTHLLDDARARGLRVVPACPYVAHFVTRHPEYADLVD